jgi:hypothetical protein
MKSRRKRWTRHVARMERKRKVGFGGKARRGETTWKTEAWMGDWLGGFGVDSPGAG